MWKMKMKKGIKDHFLTFFKYYKKIKFIIKYLKELG